MPYVRFVPGIDPGLRAWLKMRQEARAAKLRGGEQISVIKDTPYKYYQHWIGSLYELSGNEINTISNRSDPELLHSSFPILAGNDDKHSRQNQLVIETLPSLSTYSMENDDLLLEQLYVAVIEKRSDLYIIQLLTTPTFAINHKVGAYSRTLLHIAIMHGDLVKTRILVERGANVHFHDIRGNTPLHLCMHGAEELMHSVDIATLLLDHGARINSVDDHGRSALHMACALQSTALVTLLIQRGGDLSLSDHNHKMPINYLHAGSELLRFVERLAAKSSRRNQLTRIKARSVATNFIADVFRVVQPKCMVCLRTLSQCGVNRQKNYRYWMYTHGRLQNERYVSQSTSKPSTAGAKGGR